MRITMIMQLEMYSPVLREDQLALSAMMTSLSYQQMISLLSSISNLEHLSTSWCAQLQTKSIFKYLIFEKLTSDACTCFPSKSAPISLVFICVNKWPRNVVFIITMQHRWLFSYCSLLYIVFTYVLFMVEDLPSLISHFLWQMGINYKYATLTGEKGGCILLNTQPIKSLIVLYQIT